ncbi:MAG: lycopene beta-cyclase CrtY [Bdellovibrionia bacterium]
MAQWDWILVGGGLANALIALFLKRLRPEIRVLLLEQSSQLGGNHTWSFHRSDVPSLAFELLQPLIRSSWDSYTVVFPSYRRDLPGGYHSITSERLHAVLSEQLGSALRLGAQAISLTPDAVTLSGGLTLQAQAVIDGRGFPQDLLTRPGFQAGYQKFLGFDVKLSAPHGLTAPLLMDVSCPQPQDGYQFFYCLPWSDDELLIENTYYSHSSELTLPQLKEQILHYAQAKGWSIEQILREEVGVLPIPLSGHLRDYQQEADGQFNQAVPCVGVRAGLFQPVTGYSLPQAAELALALSAQSDLRSDAVLDFLQRHRKRVWKKGRYFRFLNRMMFRASDGPERYRIFESFYRHRAPLIERFYSGNLNTLDYARILMMKPPVSVYRALKAVRP